MYLARLPVSVLFQRFHCGFLHRQCCLIALQELLKALHVGLIRLCGLALCLGENVLIEVILQRFAVLCVHKVRS